MVSRKSSLLQPTAPPPPPPPDQSHHTVDSTELPPVPAYALRQHASRDYEDMGNPWNDEKSSSTQRQGQAASNTLSTGSTEPQRQNKSAVQELPDILRPGWSAEVTPRSSFDSDRSPEREWWEDDDDEEEGEKEEPQQGRETQIQTDGKGDKKAGGLPNQSQGNGVPESLQVKRKPVNLSGSPQPQEESISHNDFPSTNPFRKASAAQQQISADLPNWGAETKGKGKDTDLQQPPSYPPAAQFSGLSLSQQNTGNFNYVSSPTPPPPPAPHQAPPPPPTISVIKSPSSEQPPLIPVSPKADHKVNPWASQNSSIGDMPSPMPFAPSQQHVTASSDDLLDRGPKHRGSVSLGDELKALPNALHAPAPSASAQSFLDDQEGMNAPRPPNAQRTESEEMYAPSSSPPPPTKPPRPAVVTGVSAEKEYAQMMEQRNETYSIKHFDWFDQRSGQMRRSSMLIQNENGPCPLLALVNALILGATQDTQAALDDALRQREQVSLGLIIETLMDELLSRALQTAGAELPDVDELNRFLLKLRTGMNANPRFVPAPPPAPNLMDDDSPTVNVPPPAYSGGAGSFEATTDIRLYGAFNVKLVHGWLPRPGDEASTAFRRSAQTYEDAQAVQFGEEELEYKLSRDGLTSHEQQIWEDITSIKSFLRAFPTQLTPYGLETVKYALERGEFAILFRNDHFSTIYKHPHDSELYTLITDAGYADRAEVIWESLVDINGARSEFYSGDFKSVSHGDSAHPVPHSQTAAANPRPSSPHLNVSQSNQGPLSPQEQQEQRDADFAMALQLQEEEEQRMRQERRASQNTQGSQGESNRGGRRLGRRGTGNIPIPLRGNNSSLSQQEVRPDIPPRNTQNRNPGVNRPADANQEDAPPAYEEAAKGTPYVPPVGSPLHPASSAEASASARASASNINLNANSNTSLHRNPNSSSPNVQATGVTAGDRIGVRRTSAYGENNTPTYAYPPQQMSGREYAGRPPPGSYGYYNTQQQATGGLDPYGLPRRERDRDCIVM